MTRIIFVFISLIIFSLQAFPKAVTTYYNNWKIREIVYDNTDTKTVTMTMKNDNNFEIYIASRGNQLSVSINWYKDRIDENTPIVEYSFDNASSKSVEPIMRSSAENFDILYTISPAFGIIQEKEMVEFFKTLIRSKSLTIRPNNYGEKYKINIVGLKQAIEKTDFSGTLFDKYKSQILR
ncbi:hypothetical protein [Brachyspira pulli]|uniref:hypothetical protein n=1 Tax=Brachyspira pulli TaxID=310721 RepID=UPI003007615A